MDVRFRGGKRLTVFGNGEKFADNQTAHAIFSKGKSMKLAALAMFLPLVLTAPAFANDQKYTFSCKYDGKIDKNDAPFYGPSFKLVIQGKAATMYDKDGKKVDDGTLSDSWKKYPNPRFFGFDEMADCASGNYMEVDKGMLEGNDGSIEITGPGNEDCAAGDVNYNCKAK